MPNVMAAQPNIGSALCESSVIPFLVAEHAAKFGWLRCRAVTLPIYQNATLGWKVNFAPGIAGKITLDELEDKPYKKCIYTLNHKKRDISFLTITLANFNRFL